MPIQNTKNRFEEVKTMILSHLGD